MNDVNLNMDFSKTVVIDAAALDRSPSPQLGVKRRRLARESAESGHATSIVRYAPGSSFPRHVHGGGEEFLVLDGEFVANGQRLGTMSWLRSPAGASTTLSSETGCKIWVKRGHLEERRL